MRIVIFGLAISSSWGNGHAALWRGLVSALLEAGHRVTFFERDVPYYAANRDLAELPEGGRLVLYSEWDDGVAARALAGADVGLVTSYCPDAAAARRAVCDSAALRCFYDLDTPVTLARLAAGETVDYVAGGLGIAEGLGAYDLVLSYTGGAALAGLRERLGARRVVALYGSVDPRLHEPGHAAPGWAGRLSYLGTYAPDRQAALEALFVTPARARPGMRFVLGGAQYPQDFPWTANMFFLRHVAPPDHPAFYASSRLTLNVTRQAMAQMGWCPSGRLFEAAACGCPVLSDAWDGLDDFFTPGEEILIARDTGDALDAIELGDAALARIAARARERTLAEHTAARRAQRMVAAFEAARHGDDPARGGAGAGARSGAGAGARDGAASGRRGSDAGAESGQDGAGNAAGMAGVAAGSGG